MISTWVPSLCELDSDTPRHLIGVVGQTRPRAQHKSHCHKQHRLAATQPTAVRAGTARMAPKTAAPDSVTIGTVEDNNHEGTVDTSLRRSGLDVRKHDSWHCNYSEMDR